MKKIISLTLALALCASLSVSALAADFSDVPENHWAYSQIQDAAGKGITSGFSDGTFRPGVEVTNAQFAVMLSRAFFAKDVEALAGQAAEEFWYWANLTAMDAKGLTKGTAMESKETWDTYAGKSINRYDMAVFLYNIMTASGKTVSAAERRAAQAGIADWSQVPSGKQTAVASVYALGLITGFSDGTFGGSKYMNRAQGCVVIGRLASCLADQTPAPGPEPEKTPEPETTRTPEPSREPEKTPEPETTRTPEPSREPEKTPEPETTRTPEPSREPEKTPELEPTQTPEPSREPEKTSEPETAQTPAPETAGPTLADGSEMTEENVRRLIEGLKTQYPEGMRWTNDNSYFCSALRITGYGCAGFAFLCSDTAFGSLPATGTHSNFDQVRVGDIIRMNNDTHSVVVLAKNGDSVTVTEGNFNSSIHWGRTISKSELVRGNFTVTTRWPA